MPVVVGIDLSLTSTGLAVVTTGERGVLAYGSVMRVASSGTKKDTLVERRERLNLIGHQVIDYVRRMDPQLVVIEAPSMASKYGHPHDRSGLWWLVVNRLMSLEYPVAAAPPTCRAKYATGKGNAAKDDVLTHVVRRYAGVMVTKNDEADALILAAMGARHLGHPIEESLPAAHVSGLDGVEWPCTAAYLQVAGNEVVKVRDVPASM